MFTVAFDREQPAGSRLLKKEPWPIDRFVFPTQEEANDAAEALAKYLGTKVVNDALHEKLKGYHYGFSVFVLDDPMADDRNVPKGIWGWAGYHNTHFWIDPNNKAFGLFMSRAREFTFDIPLNIRKIVYRKN